MTKQIADWNNGRPLDSEGYVIDARELPNYIDYSKLKKPVYLSGSHNLVPPIVKLEYPWVPKLNLPID